MPVRRKVTQVVLRNTPDVKVDGLFFQISTEAGQRTHEIALRSEGSFFELRSVMWVEDSLTGSYSAQPHCIRLTPDEATEFVDFVCRQLLRGDYKEYAARLDSCLSPETPKPPVKERGKK